VKWLGLTAEDLDTFNIPENCYQPLVKWDESRIESLLRSPGVKVLRWDMRLVLTSCLIGVGQPYIAKGVVGNEGERTQS